MLLLDTNKDKLFWVLVSLAFSMRVVLSWYLLFRMSESGILCDINEFRSLEPFLLIKVVAVELIEDVALNGLTSLS